MASDQTNETVKQPYQAPTLNKHRRLAEVTEGIVPVTVTGGSAPTATPTSTPPA
jgi:hypothetical protein